MESVSNFLKAAIITSAVVVLGSSAYIFKMNLANKNINSKGGLKNVSTQTSEYSDLEDRLNSYSDKQTLMSTDESDYYPDELVETGEPVGTVTIPHEDTEHFNGRSASWNGSEFANVFEEEGFHSS